MADDTDTTDSIDITDVAAKATDVLKQHQDNLEKLRQDIDIQQRRLDELQKGMDAIKKMGPGKFGSKLMKTTDFEAEPGSSGARIPPTVVPDYKFFYEDMPDVGSETTAPHPSVQEQEDKVRILQMHDLLNQSLAAIDAHNYALANQIFDQRDKLKEQSPSYQKTERSYERRRNIPIDAGVIQAAADAFHATLEGLNSRRDK